MIHTKMIHTKYDGQPTRRDGTGPPCVTMDVSEKGSYDKVDKLRGMDIAITTSALKDSDAKELLKCFNFPFRGKNG